MSTFADRIKETSTTTGTGDFTLAGAVTGYQTFNTGIGTNLPIIYVIEAVDGSGVPTGEWETGNGYLSSSNTLVRDIVDDSSNSAALVNFSAGTKNVFCDINAHRARAPRQFCIRYGLP